MTRTVVLSALLLLCFGLAAFWPLGAVGADDDDGLGIAVIESPDGKDSYSIETDINFTARDQGDIVYLWNFGDGSALATGREVTHSYKEYGEYNVVLTCIDEQGRWDNDTLKIKVLGVLGSSPVYIQVLVTVCCLLPFFLPFILVFLIAVVAKKVIKAAAKTDWKVKHLTILGVVIISFPIYLIVSMFVMVLTLNPLPCLFIGIVIVAGTIAWIGAGFVSIVPLGWVVRLLLKLPLDFRNGLCIVRKPLPIEKKFVGEQKKFSLKNFLEFCCDLSLNPLFLTFFIMSLVSYNLQNPWDFFNLTTGIILILAPVITFFVIPIQILLDSNLMYVKKDRKSGILMVYLGATFKNFLQNLLGVGAIAAFISIFLKIGSGAEIDQIFLALVILSLIIPVIYPGIFLVTCIYAFVHNSLVKKFNDRLDRIILKEYRIKEHKEDTRFIAMVPITYQTQTLEQIQRNDGLSEKRIQ